jgi:hypothetical protein
VRARSSTTTSPGGVRRGLRVVMGEASHRARGLSAEFQRVPDSGRAGPSAYSEPVFGRSKTVNEEQAESVARPQREGAKNRPTPKRREQEAARRRPLVETDRKSARERDRQARREAQAKQRQAMVTGDDAGLPPRDKGPVRRYIRNFVDARWNLGEFMLPVMLVVLALSFIRSPWVFAVVSIGVYGLLFAAVLDGYHMWRRLKRRLTEKFGTGANARGLAMYAMMRAFQIRRSRMPRPQVSRGDKLA